MKKDGLFERNTLAKIFLVCSITVTIMMTTMVAMTSSASASGGFAKVNNPDFDITSVNHDFSMTVAGTAGGTIPSSSREIFAYIFVLDNSTETVHYAYAVVSHPGFSDSSEANGASDWHAHFVKIDAATHCVLSINDAGTASLIGNTVSVTGTDPKRFAAAGVTAILKVNTGTGQVCASNIIDGPVASA